MSGFLNLIKTGTTIVKAHKREVLLGVTVISSGLFGISCYKNGCEISKAVRDAKLAKAMDITDDGDPIDPDNVRLTFDETIRVIWKPSTKIILPFLLSSGSAIALYSIDGKIIGGLTTALGSALTTSKALEDATREVVGDSKFDEIKTKASDIVKDDKAKTQPRPLKEKLTRGFKDWDKVLFQDDFGRLLELSKLELQEWENKANYWIDNGDNFAINQFYSDSNSEAALFPGVEGYNLGFHEMNGHVRFIVDWDTVISIDGGYKHEHSLAYRLHYIRDNGLCTLDDLRTGSPVSTFDII